MSTKEQLTKITQALMAVHRSLLQYQKEIQEIFDGKKYTPHETLNLAINSPEFEWLKLLSNSILAIDEALDEETANPDLILKEAQENLSRIFDFNSPGPHAEFQRKLEHAMKKNMNLWDQVAHLKKLIVLKN